MDFDENKKFSYCGCEISSSGQMVILFSEGNLGSNINNAFDKNHITKALNEAPSTPSGLSFISRLYITQVYNKEIPKTQEKINKLLQTEITLDPNFEQTFSTLKASKTKMRNNDWEENLGSFLRYYFEGLVSNLESAKFGEDDMLMEGFTDAVDKSRVSFRIVDAGVMKASYNECVIEDGVLYIQVRLPWVDAYETAINEICRLLRSTLARTCTILVKRSSICSRKKWDSEMWEHS